MNKKDSELVIFLIPPEKFIGGGIISIFSLCAESRKTLPSTTDVLIATYPGTPTYGKNDSFENDEIIYDFDEVAKKYNGARSIIIHVPEYSVEFVARGLKNYHTFLNSTKNLQINVLNQNIKMMPDESIVASLMQLTPNVTQTTAHLRYTTQEQADRYNIPTHLFSVKIDPHQYIHTEFEDKEDIVLFSPDDHPLKSKLMEVIKAKTSFEVIEMHDLTFEEYKSLIARGKFTVTFGEGMDGYFIESIYSKSIGFAAYNEEFFPSPEYLKLANVYPDYEAMASRVVDDIQKFNDSAKLYKSVNTEASILLNKIYDEHFFKNNVRRFYNHDYSFIPTKKINEKFLWHIIDLKDARIEKDQLSSRESIESIKSQLIAKHDELMALEKIADDRLRDIEALRGSLSWKITRPIRKGKDLLKRRKRN